MSLKRSVLRTNQYVFQRLYVVLTTISNRQTARISNVWTCWHVSIILYSFVSEEECRSGKANFGVACPWQVDVHFVKAWLRFCFYTTDVVTKLDHVDHPCHGRCDVRRNYLIAPYSFIQNPNLWLTALPLTAFNDSLFQWFYLFIVLRSFWPFQTGAKSCRGKGIRAIRE